MAQKILGEALAAGAVVSGNGFFAAVVDVKAGVLPGVRAANLKPGDSGDLKVGWSSAGSSSKDSK